MCTGGVAAATLSLLAQVTAAFSPTLRATTPFIRRVSDVMLESKRSAFPTGTARSSLQMIGVHTSRLLKRGNDGKLKYIADDNGNTIPDFSYVGYKNGEAIPDVPIVKEISPIAGDNRDRILSAIKEVSKMPMVNGFRGALLLKRGTYKIGDQISIRTSGVVLRGEGSSSDGTKIVATEREKSTLFKFVGAGAPVEKTSTRVKIRGSYIPVGARIFEVKSHNFRVGDNVFLTREPKDKWISMLHMDDLDNGGDEVNWTADDFIIRYKRVVKAIDGNSITLDAPLVDNIEDRYATGYISKYTWSGKIENVGIENIRLASVYDKKDDEDEDHAWNAVVFDNCQDAWARDVKSYYFAYSCVNVGSQGYRISVLKSKMLDPIARTKGGRKYSFCVTGQLVLVKDCRTRGGRHDYVTKAQTAGPNVFVDCEAEQMRNDSGPHGRYTTGSLYDNFIGKGDMITYNDDGDLVGAGRLDVQNRVRSGSGHGWAGAQVLFYNCDVGEIVIQSPKKHINWAIGCMAKKITAVGYWTRPGRKDEYHCKRGYEESNNKHVWPPSLYAQQLTERLGNY